MPLNPLEKLAHSDTEPFANSPQHDKRDIGIAFFHFRIVTAVNA